MQVNAAMSAMMYGAWESARLASQQQALEAAGVTTPELAEAYAALENEAVNLSRAGSIALEAALTGRMFDAYA